MKKERIITLALIFIIFIVSVIGAFNYKKPEIINLLNLILVAGLMTVTAVYAYFTEKMAEEMREQRVMASRPVIIEKAVYKESGLTGSQIQWLGTETSDISYFSHFDIYNAGNGPAIDVEISLLNKEKTPLDYVRNTFLRTTDPPIKFYLPHITNLDESMTYYLICEYKSILSSKIWYQTQLAFKPSKSSKQDELLISVVNTLEFKEVTEEKRINAFSRLTHSSSRLIHSS